MKLIIVIAFLFSQTLEASELNLEIEKNSANLNSCSTKRPCIISIDKNKNHYIAKVRSFKSITNYGVLKTTTGSITYYIYDLSGKLLRTKRTT